MSLAPFCTSIGMPCVLMLDGQATDQSILQWQAAVAQCICVVSVGVLMQIATTGMLHPTTHVTSAHGGRGHLQAHQRCVAQAQNGATYTCTRGECAGICNCPPHASSLLKGLLFVVSSATALCINVTADTASVAPPSWRHNITSCWHGPAPFSPRSSNVSKQAYGCFM